MAEPRRGLQQTLRGLLSVRVVGVGAISASVVLGLGLLFFQLYGWEFVQVQQGCVTPKSHSWAHQMCLKFLLGYTSLTDPGLRSSRAVLLNNSAAHNSSFCSRLCTHSCMHD